MKLFSTRPRRGASGLTVIDERLTIRGDIDTDGTVRVDGRVEGQSHRLGSLIVGRNGAVTGDIEAAEVVVAGTVTGNVHAAGRVEIEPGASVRGNVRASALTMREGASINGQFRIEAEAAAEDRADERLELSTEAFPPRHVAA